MKKDKRARLEAAGWRVGGAKEFLGLSDDEAAIVEIRIELARLIRETRLLHGWTQVVLAEMLESSQSRVAKMEAADNSVSIDLMVRSLISMGAPGKSIGTAFAGISTKRAAKRSA